MTGMQRILPYQLWLKLPPDVRHKLATLFDIPKTGSTTVEYRADGNRITSDGYTPVDLCVVTVEKMQSVLNSDSEDFFLLLEQVIDNIDPILGGTFFSQKGPHIPTSDTSHPPKRRVSAYGQFVKLKSQEGLKIKEIAALWKSEKAKHGTI